MPTAKLVMIVDDDRDLRETLGELLNYEGYRTILCENGASALQQLREGPEYPDLILLDLMMPRMNGWEFRKQQLEKPALATVPVVVMTASRDVGDIQADDVVFKPPNLEKLFDVIKQQVGTDNERPDN